MTRSILIWCIGAGAVALAVFAWLTLSASSLMMSFALYRVERGYAPSLNHPDAIGRNRMVASQLVDERYGPDSYYLFTRPNPDIMYSGCSYDLKTGPVEIWMRNPPEYASIALHDANTDNFGVLGNENITHPYLGLLIVEKGTTPPPFDGPIFESSTRRGMAIPRILIEQREDLDRYLELQADQHCQLYKP